MVAKITRWIVIGEVVLLAYPAITTPGGASFLPPTILCWGLLAFLVLKPPPLNALLLFLGLNVGMAAGVLALRLFVFTYRAGDADIGAFLGCVFFGPPWGALVGVTIVRAGTFVYRLIDDAEQRRFRKPSGGRRASHRSL